jgi:hypothetical protein
MHWIVSNLRGSVHSHNARKALLPANSNGFRHSNQKAPSLGFIYGSAFGDWTLNAIHNLATLVNPLAHLQVASANCRYYILVEQKNNPTNNIGVYPHTLLVC